MFCCRMILECDKNSSISYNKSEQHNILETFFVGYQILFILVYKNTHCFNNIFKLLQFYVTF